MIEENLVLMLRTKIIKKNQTYDYDYKNNLILVMKFDAKEFAKIYGINPRTFNRF